MSKLRTSLWIVLLAVLCASFTLAPAASAAEPEATSADAPSGWQIDPRPYVEYSLGVSFVRNQNLTGGDPPNPDFSGRTQTDPGLTVGGAVGVRLYGQFRTEIALGYHVNEVSNIGVRRGETRSNGSLSLFTALVNGYYDYDLAGFGVPLVAFAGAGVGFGQAELDAENRGGGINVDDDNAVFTWNVMAGVTYAISEVTDFSLGYRYLATDDIRYKGRIAGSGVRWIDSEYDAHDVTLGLRFNF